MVRVRVGLGLCLGVGLVASLLLIAGCRFTIPPESGSGYWFTIHDFFCFSSLLFFSSSTLALHY